MPLAPANGDVPKDPHAIPESRQRWLAGVLLLLALEGKP